MAVRAEPIAGDLLPASPDRRFREAVAGTLAVAFALFGSRWASHLGFGGLYLTDLLIALGIGHLLATRLRHPDSPPLDRSFRRPHPLLFVYVAWAAIRLVAGWRLDMDALRDAVPYLYAAVGIIAAISLRRSTPLRRERTARILVAALGAHAAWVFVVTLAPGVRDQLPVMSVALDLPLFALRWDFDTPVVGIFAAWLLVRLVRGARHQAMAVAALAVCLFTIMATGSRAGLIGAFMALLLGAAVAVRGRDVPSRRKVAAVAALPLLVAAVAVIVPQTAIGDRLAGTFGSGSTVNKGSANAAGTTEARDRTWQFLWDYSSAEPERHLFGVGYGPNFLSETRSAILLVGTNDESEAEPRSPHNYWIGTLVRGGLVAVGIFAALVLLMLVRTVQLVGSMAGNDMVFLAGAIPVALLFPATFGVIFESPFGAVPFFWACGVVLAWPRPVPAAHDTRRLAR